MTPQREQFCRGVALEGLGNSEAYAAAYDTSGMKPKTIADRGYDLTQVPAVAARISVLKERATDAVVKVTGYTMAEALSEAEDARALARAEGQASAAVAAITLKAKLAGHLVERKEVRSGPLDEADVAKLLALKAHIESEMAREKEVADLVGGHPEETPRPVRRVIG